MNKAKIIYVLPQFLILIISLLILIFTIYGLEKDLSKEYEHGYEDGKRASEYEAVYNFFDMYEDYYELYADYKVLEERLAWLSPDIVVHKFDKNYNFYLLVIVSRTKVNDDIWLYGIQEIGNTDEIVYVESDALFSVDEKVIAVEISGNQVILIDISN